MFSGKIAPYALLLAALAACASAPRTPQEIEAHLRSRLTCVEHDAELELWSARKREECELWWAAVRAEAGLARQLLAAPAEPALRIYLVPAESDAELAARPWVPVAQGTYTAGSFDEGFLFAFVPESGSKDAFSARAVLTLDTLRHEFVHAYAARLGLAREPWFNEGLALEVEFGRAVGNALELAPYPSRFATARETLREGALAELLAWRRGERLDRVRGLRLYANAHALVRFLLERDPAGGTWRERVLRLHARTNDEVAQLESEWLAWWRAYDPLPIVRERLASNDAETRRIAALTLPEIAEAGAASFATRAADELALGLLSDRTTFEPAARFLVYFRANSLRADDLEQLALAPDPHRRIFAVLLRAKRGEAFDDERARRDYANLTADERAPFGALPIPASWRAAP